MKNFNGTPLEINQIQGVNFLGYELVDKENGIRYELVNEPWVSLAAAAAKNGGGRRVATGDVQVLFADTNWESNSLIINNVPDVQNMDKVFSMEELLEYIYSIDYNGFSLKIYFGIGIPKGDYVINSSLLRFCEKVYINFVSEHIKNVNTTLEDFIENWLYPGSIIHDGEKVGFCIGIGRLTFTGEAPFQVGGVLGITGNRRFDRLIRIKHGKVFFEDFWVKIFWGEYYPGELGAPILIDVDNFSTVIFARPLYICFARPGEGLTMPEQEELISNFQILRVDNFSNVKTTYIGIFQANGSTNNIYRWILEGIPFLIRGHSHFVYNSGGFYEYGESFEASQDTGVKVLENGICSITKGFERLLSTLHMPQKFLDSGGRYITEVID